MMDPIFINPIDLMPFIGGSQHPEGRKNKLIQLYQADAKNLLDKGDIDAYNRVMEKIKELQGEENENNEQNNLKNENA